jgi:SAM-dependent methyltransferase
LSPLTPSQGTCRGAFVRYVALGPSDSGNNLIPFAYPYHEGDHRLNVICGPNATGKSYLLSAIASFLTGGSDGTHRDLSIVLSQEVEPQTVKSLYLEKLWQRKATVGSYELASAVQISDPASYLETAKADFLRRQIRMRFVHTNPKFSPGFAGCDRADPLVRDTEDILGGTLGLRVEPGRRGKSDLALAFSPSDIWNFEDWSDGQQAVFYMLLLAHHAKPDVLLIDELENHLHPQFMSGILAAVRRTVPQTIIATHHPHLIFSKYADRVIRLDVTRPEAIPPGERDRSRDEHRTVRTATVLEDGFEKLVESYKLFDQQDNLLLRQADHIQTQADLELYNLISTVFVPQLSYVSGQPWPDKQTAPVAESLRAHCTGGAEVLVLDIGSGTGRMALEFAKLAKPARESRVRWLCWEPDVSHRAALRRGLTGSSLKVDVLNSLDEVADGTVDLCVVANVLHELAVQDAARVLVVAGVKLQPDVGELAILELYPLIRAEKYAVPYPPELLKALLDSIGLFARYHPFPVRDTTGYCMFARRVADWRPDETQIVRSLRALWQQLLTNALHSYASRWRMSGYQDYRSVLQELTTVISVVAADKSLWTPTR